MRMLFPSAAARELVIQIVGLGHHKYGAIEGGNQTLARPAERLAEKKLD
jgi:hypothetical protein